MFKYLLSSLFLCFSAQAQTTYDACAGIGRSDLGFSTTCTFRDKVEPVSYLFSTDVFSNSRDAQAFCTQQSATPYLVDDARFYMILASTIRPTVDLIQHLRPSFIYGGATQSDFFITWNPPSTEELVMVEGILNDPVELAKFEEQANIKLTKLTPYQIVMAYDIGFTGSWVASLPALERDKAIEPGLKLPAICTSSK
jgi:hypothetical protein